MKYQLLVKGTQDEVSECIARRGLNDGYRFRAEAPIEASDGNCCSVALEMVRADARADEVLNEWFAEPPVHWPPLDAPFPAGTLLHWSSREEEDVPRRSGDDITISSTVGELADFLISRDLDLLVQRTTDGWIAEILSDGKPAVVQSTGGTPIDAIVGAIASYAKLSAVEQS